MAKRRVPTETETDTTETMHTHSAEETGPSGPPKADESDVKRPKLEGKNKVKLAYEQPGTNNQSREDIGGQ